MKGTLQAEGHQEARLGEVCPSGHHNLSERIQSGPLETAYPALPGPPTWASCNP